MGAPNPGTTHRPRRIEIHRRRRRPVGEPPPLPRDLHGAAVAWILVAVVLAVLFAWGQVSGVVGELQRTLDRNVASAIDGIPDDGVVRTIEESAGWWALLIWCRWAIIVALIVFRRWRHLAVFVASVVMVDVLTRLFPTAGIQGSGVESHASPAAADLAVTMAGIIYGLVPHGRWRHLAKLISAALWVAVAAALLVTREDTFGDIVIGGAIGVVIPFLGYRVFTPDAAFPVTYRHGRTAHLEIDDRREAAISSALTEQLGIEVASLAPFGLDASGGSTPLRIVTAEGDVLFAKLYATSHLRADRWYKLGRAVRYGQLEDERPFNSVRRMVEYEDHMLRYLRDAGLAVPEPYGVAELTPEREYLIVTSFVDGVELTEAEVNDDVIRSGIAVVGALWEAGIAHRDVKPANLLVTPASSLVVIDVAFCQLRPSPWRQSVDLANMLLCLGLRNDAGHVYDLATERFTPDEIAEAFAASRGVTIPGQLRGALDADPRDLRGAFTEMAPARDPVRIQRWTVRRVSLLAGLIALACALVTVSALNLRWAGFQP